MKNGKKICEWVLEYYLLKFSACLDHALEHLYDDHVWWSGTMWKYAHTHTHMHLTSNPFKGWETEREREVK